MSSQSRSPSHLSRDADGLDENTPAKLSFLAYLGLQPVSSSPKCPTSSATQEPGERMDPEMARLVAKTLLRWKLEAQAVAQATKEARRKKAIKAAEDRQLKREQKKLLEQEKKNKRIEKLRLGKELREKQILEEKEMQRVQAKILKQKEKELLKKQKLDEKRINKEKKLQLRILEREKAKALKKTKKATCVADLKETAQVTSIQEEQLEETEMEWVCSPAPESQKNKHGLNLILKKVAKKAQSHRSHPYKRQKSSNDKLF
ncbi:unnamed protein product [Pleuronectes platessa]|uniref:Uncharacterized protein n=1 Tax=Pleuronectes platessa TaxID=8262 RepID=A0A9N7YM94_PLEPL|nr:unnamed protein product [Pleuronectes platessa]